MAYYFPFGQELHQVVQKDRSPKKVFVLGVYASAVHARWTKEVNGKDEDICKALAVASEPRIFWDGNEDEAKEIIEKIHIPEELGRLEPAAPKYNGPSAKTLDSRILCRSGYTRDDAWLCDLLPESRANTNQIDAIQKYYEPVREQYGLNEATVPRCPSRYCDDARRQEIVDEIMESGADKIILLGKHPFDQFLTKVADVKYSSFGEYVDAVGYAAEAGRDEKAKSVVIGGKALQILPFVHPRTIDGYGNRDWMKKHIDWENKINQA